ncbi:MAG: AAA family ATPase [Candidatus ainarchaeum sp.]|nr:AAA family ATPase [Candidatus ainarchaeum sp.]
MNTSPKKENFYIRSSYRFEQDFKMNQVSKKKSSLEDINRPKRMMDLDSKVKDNYERIVGKSVGGVFSKDRDDLKVKDLREEIIGKVQKSMEKIFPELVLEGAGNPLEEGNFFFEKGISKHFPFKNLSAGEKSAFDLILDLIIKLDDFNDTIIAIDEPETHMHSELQQSLLAELYNLIPNNCQLWIATHSIGFIRKALDLKKIYSNNIILFNFADLDADKKIELSEMNPDIKNIRKVFTIAIDDLAEMITPSNVVICEGSIIAPQDSSKKDFDTIIYNNIFKDKDVLFISGNSKRTATESAKMLYDVIKKAGALKNVLSVVDRDDLTSEQVLKFETENSYQKFLKRKTIENYLFDNEIIDKYCENNEINKEMISTRITNFQDQDVKGVQSSIMQQCGYCGEIDQFKKDLSLLITPETNVYKELKTILNL